MIIRNYKLFFVEIYIFVININKKNANQMQIKFEEGENYTLKYIKTIFIEQEYFVFEYNNNKHLLPVKYFADYGFKLGEFVNTKVLRIDCLGKVDFEPEHSYYKIDNIYEFNFKEIEVEQFEENEKFKVKLKKEKIFNIVITDIYGNEHNVAANKNQQNKKFKTDKIKCRIDKIIKGNFILTNMETDSTKKRFKIKFKVI